LLFGEKSEELTAWTILQDEEQFLFILEGMVEVDDEGMIHSYQYVALGHHMAFLLSLLNIFLLEYFHGINFF